MANKKKFALKSNWAGAGDIVGLPYCFFVKTFRDLTALYYTWRPAWSWMNDGRSNSLKQALQPPGKSNKEHAGRARSIHLTIAVWHSTLLKKSFFMVVLVSFCSNTTEVSLLSGQILCSGWNDHFNSSWMFLIRITGECCSIYEFRSFSSWSGPKTQWGIWSQPCHHLIK